MPKWNKYSLATAAGLGALLLWSATFAVARSLSEKVGAITGGAAVYFIAGGMLWIWRGWRSRRGTEDPANLRPRYLFGCGSLFILYTVLIYWAVGLARDRAQLLEIALVNYLWPALTILFSILLLNKQAGLLLWPGTGLALAGVFFVLTQGSEVSWRSFWMHMQSNPAAYAGGLVAAIAWGLYSNLTRRWSEGEDGGAVDRFMVTTGLILLLLRLIVKETTTWSLQAWLEAAFLGVITGAAYALWEFAMRKGNLLLVAVCSYFTPLLSTIVSCVYLKVLPGQAVWSGCLLLVLGSLLTWRSVAQRPLSAAGGVTPPEAAPVARTETVQ